MKKVIFALCMEGPIICLCIVLVPTALMGNIGINVMFYGFSTDEGLPVLCGRCESRGVCAVLWL